MRLEMIIFAIDNSSNVHSQAKFLRHVDTLRAMGKLVGGVTQCIGSYGGILERSYMMTVADFDKHVRHSGFVSEQDSFLRVPGDTRQPCVLEYQSSGTQETLNPMEEIYEDCSYLNWTYVEETGKYFSC